MLLGSLLLEVYYKHCPSILNSKGKGWTGQELLGQIPIISNIFYVEISTDKKGLKRELIKLRNKTKNTATKSIKFQ